MAAIADNTHRRVALALFGRSPFTPVPVEVRPASFSDALDQYRRAVAREAVLEWGLKGADNATEKDNEAAFDGYIEGACRAVDALSTIPAPDLPALADKIEAINLFGDWSAHAAAVLADARRLAGAA